MWRILDGKDGLTTRVYLNGEDVSRRCFRAIAPVESGVEGPGQVWLVKHDARGQLYRELGCSGAAQEVLEGMVRWEPIRPGGDDKWWYGVPVVEPVATC